MATALYVALGLQSHARARDSGICCVPSSVSYRVRGVFDAGVRNKCFAGSANESTNRKPGNSMYAPTNPSTHSLLLQSFHGSGVRLHERLLRKLLVSVQTPRLLISTRAQYKKRGHVDEQAYPVSPESKIA